MLVENEGIARRVLDAAASEELMGAFGDVGQAGQIDAAKLAQGIALILRATLIGLLIAIPALITWSYYTKKVEMLAVEMETLCDEFIRRQYREGKK